MLDYNFTDVGARDANGNAVAGLGQYTVQISTASPVALGAVPNAIRVDVRVTAPDGAVTLLIGISHELCRPSGAAMNARRAAGFTLIELIVALTISTIIVGFVATFHRCAGPGAPRADAPRGACRLGRRRRALDGARRARRIAEQPARRRRQWPPCRGDDRRRRRGDLSRGADCRGRLPPVRRGRQSVRRAGTAGSR